MRTYDVRDRQTGTQIIATVISRQSSLKLRELVTSVLHRPETTTQWYIYAPSADGIEDFWCAKYPVTSGSHLLTKCLAIILAQVVQIIGS